MMVIAGTPNPDSPETLLSRIASGDKHAEEALVRRYWRGLFIILVKDCGEQALAQDLAQDTFAVVLRKARAGQIDNPKALGAFIRQTAVNLLIAYKRKQSRQNTFSSDKLDAVCTPVESLPEHLNRDQLLELVRQTLDEMHVERDRQILLSYFVYGVEKHILCEQMDLTAEYFDKVLHRARSRLKHKILLQLGLDLADHSIGKFLMLLFTVQPVLQFVFSG